VLFSARDSRGGLSDGIADMGTIIAAYTPQEMVAYTFADLPLINPDAWVGMRAAHDIVRGSDAIQAHLADQNLAYITAFTTSAVQLLCAGDPVLTVEDIDGRRVRGIGAYGRVFSDVGANMVNMSIYEAYQGLDSGLLDCSQTYAYATRSLRQYEVADSLTLMNWGQVGAFGIFMNADSYNALTEEQQAVLMEVADEFPDHYGELLIADNEDALEAMAAGIDGRALQIVEMPADQRDRLVERGQAYIEDWVENAAAAGLPAEQILADYRAAIDHYNQVVATEGYPWAD